MLATPTARRKLKFGWRLAWRNPPALPANNRPKRMAGKRIAGAIFPLRQYTSSSYRLAPRVINSTKDTHENLPTLRPRNLDRCTRLPAMRDDYLFAALKVIDDPNILVNVVSRRVKQLKRGNRALVESLEKLLPEDTALREIIEGKISYEVATPEELVRSPGGRGRY
jgi:DNA-directed RNA polymerase subunit omega